MKLILHIGTEKTGTTSIQKFLTGNRENLIENNIYIPITLMAGNAGAHRWLPYLAIDGDFTDLFLKRQQFKTSQSKKKKINSIKKQLSLEFQNIPKIAIQLLYLANTFKPAFMPLQTLKRCILFSRNTSRKFKSSYI